ncbi:trans-aconitate 2-methyltransferase [Bacteroides sp.]|uniref:class I SAM-dependent methyltransferase n=1 Tax=Bacteroides sp. TaxID=29523 RepID=UPI0026078F5C|nr:class I SAM-dependent methyltransferase [Bacteroides sp.]
MRNKTTTGNKTAETIQTYDLSAQSYQDKFMLMDLYDDTYDRFCELVKGSAPSILEIGTGPGNVTKYLLSRRPDFKVSGIDLAPQMIELARQNNPQGEFDVMDCREIHKIGRKFKGIMCAFCLPYLSKEDSRELISNISQLLEPGGVLYISTMEDDYAKSGYETTSFSGINRVYVYYHQENFIAGCLEESGFKIVDLQKKRYPEQDGSFLTDMIFIAQKK